MRLTADIRPVDQRRGTRLLIAWSTGDKYALDVVLSEAADDPIGTPALLFFLIEVATSLGQQLAPDDFADQLRTSLLGASDGDDLPPARG